MQVLRDILIIFREYDTAFLRLLEWMEKSTELKLPPLINTTPTSRRSLLLPLLPARLLPSPSAVDIGILVPEAGEGRDDRNKEWGGGAAAFHDATAENSVPHPSAVSSVTSCLYP